MRLNILSFCTILYNYERRNINRRADKNVGRGIGIITVYSESKDKLLKKENKKAMELLSYTLFKSFRCGDVVSRWNENQMLILLYGLRKEHIRIVVDRVNDNFNLAKHDENLSLNIKLNVL